MIREGKLSAVRNNITSNNFPNKAMGHNLEETDQACHEITTPMAEPHFKSALEFRPCDRMQWNGLQNTRPETFCNAQNMKQKPICNLYRHCG
jgi:hypothetical protein